MSNSFGAVIPVTGPVLGFPGKISRLGDRIVAARQVLPTTPNAIAFGQAVVINGASNTYQSVSDFIAGGGTMTAARFAGIAIAEVKTTLGYPTVPGGSQVGSYAPSDYAEVLERGSIRVAINNGAPVSQGSVFLRIAANGAIPAGVVGGLEAVADGANTVQLQNVAFRTGILDANGIAEITLLTRVAA